MNIIKLSLAAHTGKGLQWKLAIPATLGTNRSGWISEVAGFQGRLLMYNRMDQSFTA